MRLLDDERGQSVQVGAAILLGFVVIAITMYQVEVVSSQNAEVEFNHDQEIRQQLTDLRNSISNAGTQGQSDSVSVKLGEQYPPRTIFVNPPPIQGALQSQQAGNISFGNAQVQGSYEGSGDPTELVSGNHTTNRLVYAPRYFELDDAGVTSIEHSLAFKAFENDVTDPITRQRVVRGDSLTLTVLQGNISEQGTQSISLDPETVSGPTDPITITNDTAGPIELYLPTETPSVWNETIGTTYTDGAQDARVADWNDGSGLLTVELRKDSYELQMALVEVGEGAGESTRYNVSQPGNSGGSGGGSGPYEIQWQDGQTETVSGGQVTLTAETNPSGFEGADVDFYLKDDGTGAEIQSEDNQTDANGEADVTLGNLSSDGTVDVYVQSGGTSDVHTITVTSSGGGGGATPQISHRIDDLSHVSTTEVDYLTSYNVSNTNGSYVRTEVVYENVNDASASQTVSDTATRGSLGYTNGYGVNDDYAISVRVIYDDGSGEYVANSVRVTDQPDAANPSGNDDLSTASSPQITSFTVSDRSSRGQGGRFDVNFGLDSTANYAEAELYAIGLANGGKDSQIVATTNGPWELNPNAGYQEDFRIAVLVKDSSGAVVDARRPIENADGT